MRNKSYLLIILALAILLMGSCNFGPGQGEEEKTTFTPEISVSAQPYAGPEAGDFFNGTGECFLSLDGEGGFCLFAPEKALRGTYTATEEELTLHCGGEEARAFPGGGGYIISGMAGVFLPVQQPSGFGELGLILVGDREYTEEEGSYRLSDYSLELALRYPDGMSAPENLISDAVVVFDGVAGYVTGRNVTADFSGDAGEFMDSYMAERVQEDFRLLYGAEGSFESLEQLDEGISGRLASAEGIILGGEERIYVKCIMYTSTYSDGTVNYICKCFFAPEGDSETFNALASSVVNMTAVRRK